MAMTLTLTLEDSEKLRKIAVLNCSEADIKSALQRCPGVPDWEEVAPDHIDKNVLTSDIIKRIGTDSAYFPSSFLLRLIEQKWELEEVRRGVTKDVASLVRPPRGVAEHVKTLADALTETVQQLPRTLVPGGVDDPVFGRVCTARDSIVTIVDSLERFESLKAVHDSLHTLQVLGADWLDELAQQYGHAAPATALLPLLTRVRDVVLDRAPKLPADLAESCLRCRDACVTASERIRTGNSDETAFACAVLRATLVREAPVFDNAMFAVSRDLPLRQFYDIFGNPAARDAALDLGDTLRRRLMEHALWQATDVHLYAVEQALAHPTEDLTRNLLRLLPWPRSALNILLDPSTARRVISPLDDTVTRFAEQPPEGLLPATVDDVRKAFSELRSAARSAFLDTDQALRQDFSQLLTLQGPLKDLLSHVPKTCEFYLPP